MVLIYNLTLSLQRNLAESITPNDYDDDNDRNVSICIVQTNTRGVSVIPDGTPLRFNIGNLYLINNDGIIIRHYQIVALGSGQASNLEAGIINRNLFSVNGAGLLSAPLNGQSSVSSQEDSMPNMVIVFAIYQTAKII